MMEEASQALDAIRSSFPVAFFVLVPFVMIVVSPVSMVSAAHEFTVYRMQQYDLQSKTYGCRNSLVNMEARTLSSSSSLARKCVVAHAKDLTYERYMEAVGRAMGALLILLPKNSSATDTSNFLKLEKELLEDKTNIPIYFAHSDENLEGLLYDVQKSTSDDSGSAVEALLNSATSVGYQLVTTGGQGKPYDHSVVNLYGYLPGLGKEEQLPTIAIVAHYDSYGIAPYLSYGANSDASGVVAVLELSRILGKLYSNSRTHPKQNILFLLSGGGKFNYQGTKRWIEDALDNPSSSSETIPNLLSNVDTVLCLDSLASDVGSIHMHVSKPPKEGSATHNMWTHLQKVSDMTENTSTTMVHKKIRLSADTLAWEHERFSIRRLPAVTLSSLQSYDETPRDTVMDHRATVNDDTLTKNIRVINEAVMRYIYNVSVESEKQISSGEYSVHPDYVLSWMDYLTLQPRPEQDMHEKHPVVTALESALQKHLKGVQKVSFKADKRDPEFVLYDGLQRTMSASMVRSAVFDLYLSIVIASYIAFVYLMIWKFSYVRGMVWKFCNFQKVKVY